VFLLRLVVYDSTYLRILSLLFTAHRDMFSILLKWVSLLDLHYTVAHADA
jgi:hypothetical protein